MNQKSNKGLIITIVSIVALAAVGLGALAFTGKSNNQVATATADTTSTPQPTTSSEPVTTTSSNPVSTSTYKDGTYTAEGQYKSPGGPDAVKVTLTLKDDVITDATVVSEANDHNSKKYQAMFISGFKQYVVGKNIDSLSVSKVSGSSLTSIGFNAAVATIKTQAQA